MGRRTRLLPRTGVHETDHADEPGADPKEVVDLPIVCLAVYEDDDLRTVLPCADGDDIYTVGDGLDALEGPDATVPGLEKRKIGTL